MKNMIRVKNLSFGYGSEPIFSKINFSVYQGEFIAIIGANGTGKSTLLKLILNEIQPVTGSIHLFEQPISKFKDWKSIGYVPQNGLKSNSDFPATAEEIVKANLYSQIGLFKFPKKEHQEKTLKALEMVNMGSYSKRMIGQMSGGQQQRVMLGRVLVNNPQLMLLDEPTTGVDSKTIIALYDLLRKLNREMGLTIVMVTHDIGRAADYVSRTLCLEEGSLMEIEKRQLEKELAHKHKHPII